MDLSGGLGGTSLSVSNTLDAVANGSVSTWSGSVQVCRAERVPKSGFLQRLEEQAALEGTEDGEYIEEYFLFVSLPCYNVSFTIDISTITDAVWEAHQIALEEAARQLDRQRFSSWTDFLKVDLLHTHTYMS